METTIIDKTTSFGKTNAIKYLFFPIINAKNKYMTMMPIPIIPEYKEKKFRNEKAILTSGFIETPENIKKIKNPIIGMNNTANKPPLIS